MTADEHDFSHDPMTPQELGRLAGLARLYLTDAEQAALVKDMEGILGHVDQLGRVQHEAIEPYTIVSQEPSGLRADEVRPSLTVEQALAAAPERLGDGFGVPKIIA